MFRIFSNKSAIGLVLIILLLATVASGCRPPSDIPPFETEHKRGSDEYYEDLANYYKRNKGASEETELVFEPYTEVCDSPFKQDCLVERNEDGSANLFYDQVEGFEFESGYTYRLRALRTQKYDFDDVPEEREDIGVYTYELLEVLEKIEQGSGSGGIPPFETEHERGSDEYFEVLANYYKRNKGANEEIELVFEPYTEECYGPFKQDCLIERSEDGSTSFFYDRIRGFEFESGYTYRLRVLKTQKYDFDDVPIDGGVYTYELLEVLEKIEQ